MRAAFLCGLILWTPILSAQNAAGQAPPPHRTHAEAFGALATACLGPAVDSVAADLGGAYRIEEPARLPFLAPLLAEDALRRGHRVYLTDSLAADPMGAVRVTVLDAGVELTRARRRRVGRSVRLALHASVTASDGRVLAMRTCRDAYQDTIPRADLEALASDAYPETRADPPAPGWVRRMLEPTLAAGATVLGAYLFFTLRSERAEDR